MTGIAAELDALARQRRWVLLDSGALLVASAALVGVAPLAEGAGADARFVFAGAAALFATAGLRCLQRLLALLHCECPRCAGSFYGLPDAIPSPLRRRCARCGLELPAPRG